MNLPHEQEPVPAPAPVDHAERVPPQEQAPRPTPTVRAKPKPRRRRRKITLVEAGVGAAVLVIGLAVGLPMYRQAMAEAAETVAIRDIKLMQRAIRAHRNEHGKFPTSLDQVGFGNKTDPWGNPYRYASFDSNAVSGASKKRGDRFLVPINTDFDLYSTGADGASFPPLSARSSRDDIVRAGDGNYIGTASIF